MHALVDAMVQEVVIRQHYLSDRTIKTVYFGGGTPSLLPTHSIALLMDEIRRHFTIDADAELTLEANPEDLSVEKLAEIRALGINRLSLGTQSFLAHELLWMNRMHTPQQAISAIGHAQDAGFDNLSIDLIFGLPQQTLAQWEQNLNTAIGLGIQHISSYGLTVEKRTKLHHAIGHGTQLPPDEATAEACFRMNMDMLPACGFEHYEISNFARKGYISRHNSAYWQGAHYLGIGPSAHSFNGTSRQWNVRSNAGYMRGIGEQKPEMGSELLTERDRVNEHIMTGLRCKWGVQRSVLNGLDATAWPRIIASIAGMGATNFIHTDDKITLSNEGKLMADTIAAELFV